MVKRNKDVRTILIEKISTIHTLDKVITFLEQEVPREFLIDEQFVQKLIESNKLVDGALDIYFNDNSKKIIEEEIREQGLESVIEDDYKLELIIRDGNEDVYSIAKQYEENGEYEKAKRIYKAIMDYGKTQINRFNARARKKRWR